MADDIPAPLDEYWSPWTSMGRRLHVTRWPYSLMISCETRAMDLSHNRWMQYRLSRIEIPNMTTHNEAEKFVRHCLGFYEDTELIVAGIDAIRRVEETMTDDGSPAPEKENLN